MQNKTRIIGFSIIFLLLMAGIIVLGLRTKEMNNTHYETATVISVKRENPMIVRFETEDGNLWDEEFDWDTPVDIGDKATLMFNNDNTETREDDVIINVFFEEE